MKKNGQTIYTTDILVSRFEFVESNKQSEKEYDDDDEFPFS